MKKNTIIGVLIIIIIILGGSIFYLNTNKEKIGCKNVCQETKNSEDVQKAENISLLKGKYKYSKHTGSKAATGAEIDLNVEINIINDTEMTISSDDTLSEIETTKGTYTINNNILTYERVYVSEGNEWTKCGETENNKIVDCHSYKLLKQENFIIDMANKSLYSTNYGGEGDAYIGHGPLTLKYQE